VIPAAFAGATGPGVRSLSDRCVRSAGVRTAAEPCEACVAACPQGAITLDPVQIDADRCDGCELCRVACRSAVFAAGDARCDDVEAAWRTVERGRPFSLVCAHAAASHGEPHFPVACLGAVGWEDALVPALLGAGEVELRHGACGSCGRSGADTAWEVVLRAANSVAGALGLGTIHAVSRPVSSPPGRGAGSGGRTLSRRDVFSLLRRRGRSAVRQAGDAAVSRVGAAVGAPATSRPAPEPLWVRDIAAGLAVRRGARVRADPRAAVALDRPAVRSDACTRCGVCAAACPTGALEAQDGRLTLRGHRCTGCDRCVRACPERAIARVVRLPLAALRPSPVALIEPDETHCAHCGGEALSPKIPVCARCYREGRGAATPLDPRPPSRSAP